MQHPFAVLEPEYANLLARMRVTRQNEVEVVARHLLMYVDQFKYAPVSQRLGIPQIFIATSFERESSSNFRDSPAQGDPWNEVSRHVPRGRGPFTSWTSAAIDAYTLDHLDKVGKDNWTWPRFCYEGELFNGFGYRAHGVHTPYDWSGTSVYEGGKYESDGHFVAGIRDEQLGIVPVARAMALLDKTLDLPGWPNQPGTAPPVPQSAPLGVGGGTDTAWVQTALNTIMHDELLVDGNYGSRTKVAAIAFQKKFDLTPDGLVGPLTLAALEKALKEGVA